MLFLNPPFYLIDGVSLFPDDQDPLQWYYMPLAPRLTTVPDSVTGADVPSIQLLMYRGSAGNGGFLNCDVNIGVPQTMLNSLRTKLFASAGLNDMPHLAPIPVIDGSVRMLLLGQVSSPPADPVPSPPHTPGGPTPPPTGTTGPAAPGEPRFVLKMDQGAKPSLYGDEQATFSIELDQDGAVALSEALNGAFTPLGVVYSLDFVALRPAYAVTLSIDWDRVQHHLDDQFGSGGLFFSSNIESVVDSLIESRDIDLQVSTFVPEGPDAGSVITDKDKAVAEVYEMITSAFFTSSIDPIKEEKDGWDRFSTTADHISMLAVTGGLSSLASFTYNHLDYTRIDQKKLQVDMSERSAVLRTIWPQGHVAGITSLVRNSGMSMDKFIIPIDLDSDFFKKRTLILNPIGITADAHMLSVDVNLSYDGDVHSVTIDPQNPQRSTVAWQSTLGPDGKMIKPVKYRYDVTFEDIQGLTRPRSLSTGELVALSDSVDIFPPADIPFALVTVPINASLSLPWDRWVQVDVDLRYVDEGNGISQVDQRSVTKAQPSALWQMFVRDVTKRAFDVRLAYRGAPDRQDHVIDWTSTSEERVSIEDPFGHRRRVQVVPVFDWTRVSRVFVDMSYEDPINDLSFQEAFQFDQAHQDPQTFVVDLEDASARRVDYSVTTIYVDAHESVVPPSATMEERIILTEGMRGNRVIVIQTDGGDFEAKGLVRIGVSCSYDDSAGGISIAGTVTLTPDNVVDSFEFPYLDDQPTAFTYALLYSYANGLSQPIDPVVTADDTVVVAVR